MIFTEQYTQKHHLKTDGWKEAITVEGTKNIQVDRIALIPVSLIWFGATVLFAYIFIKGIKCGRSERK